MRIPINARMKAIELLRNKVEFKQIVSILKEQYGVSVSLNYLSTLRYTQKLPKYGKVKRYGEDLLNMLREEYPIYGGYHALAKARKMGYDINSVQVIFNLCRYHGIKRQLNKHGLNPDVDAMPKRKTSNLTYRHRIPAYGISNYMKTEDMPNGRLFIKLPGDHPHYAYRRARKNFHWMQLASYLYCLANKVNHPELVRNKYIVLCDNHQALFEYYDQFTGQMLDSAKWKAIHEQAISDGILDKAQIHKSRRPICRKRRPMNIPTKLKREWKRRYPSLGLFLIKSPLLISQASPHYDTHKTMMI